MKEMLKILARGGAELGGRLTDKKLVLAQRLAHWLNRAIDAGRAAPDSASDAEGALLKWISTNAHTRAKHL